MVHFNITRARVCDMKCTPADDSGTVKSKCIVLSPERIDVSILIRFFVHVKGAAGIRLKNADAECENDTNFLWFFSTLKILGPFVVHSRDRSPSIWS